VPELQAAGYTVRPLHGQGGFPRLPARVVLPVSAVQQEVQADEVPSAEAHVVSMTVTRPRELVSVTMSRESWERVAVALARAGYRQELTDVFINTAIDPSDTPVTKEDDWVPVSTAWASPR
jgi:hypothetical protein